MFVQSNWFMWIGFSLKNWPRCCWLAMSGLGMCPPTMRNCTRKGKQVIRCFISFWTVWCKGDAILFTDTHVQLLFWSGTGSGEEWWNMSSLRWACPQSVITIWDGGSATSILKGHSQNTLRTLSEIMWKHFQKNGGGLIPTTLFQSKLVWSGLVWSGLVYQIQFTKSLADIHLVSRNAHLPQPN